MRRVRLRLRVEDGCGEMTLRLFAFELKRAFEFRVRLIKQISKNKIIIAVKFSNFWCLLLEILCFALRSPNSNGTN